jgi:hypothetical protein
MSKPSQREVVLTLDVEEAADLTDALATRLVGLRTEVVRSDDREYRAALKTITERLERVLARLEQSSASTRRSA